VCVEVGNICNDLGHEPLDDAWMELTYDGHEERCNLLQLGPRELGGVREAEAAHEEIVNDVQVGQELSKDGGKAREEWQDGATDVAAQ